MDLLGTIYAFPDLKTNKDRTRIIVFATDNAVEGTPIVSLEEACELCKQYGINIYAHCPTQQMNIYATEEKANNYKKAIEQIAGGKFYRGDLSATISNIVTEIKETKTSAFRTNQKTYATDYPIVPFICSVALFLLLIILEKRIKL